MDAKELRIGNLICFLGKQIEIEGIFNLPERPDMYRIKPKGGLEFKIIHAKPISLTEDILLKAGFELPNLMPERNYDEPDEVWYQIISKSWNFEGMYLNGLFPYIHKEISVCLKAEDSLYYLYEENNYADESSGIDTIYKGFKYVHELQNLYLALTCEELTINF